jgi:hypothetical protein
VQSVYWRGGGLYFYRQLSRLHSCSCLSAGMYDNEIILEIQ